MNVVAEAQRVIHIEANALIELADRINNSFEDAVDIILCSRGRVIVTGMGKSGLIGQKIASTLASTGTPAFFLHPAEGIHGDLGMIMKGDVVIAISNSGETEEMLRILPVIKRIGATVIAMSGNNASTLARCSEVFLDVSVKEEACPLGLAPTASTTTTLAMGDALAVALVVKRGFSAEDFAIFHPGGMLGKKLLLMVEDLMHVGNAIPLVETDVLMREALFVMTEKGLGVVGVAEKNGALVGVITDGDLRRALEKGIDILAAPAVDMMKKNPKIINKNELAAKALKNMEDSSITTLFVMGEENSYPVGIIHLHDLLKAGLA